MNDIHLIQEIERYLDGEMSVPEREAFDALRRNDPAIDRQVTEHRLLLQQLRANGARKELLRRMEVIHASGGAARFGDSVARLRRGLVIASGAS